MHATHVVDTNAELHGELAGILRGPDAVIAAIPYLLGFHPQDSLVIVWMQQRRICLTQRADLPAVDDGGGLEVDAVAIVATNAKATSAIAVIYGEHPHTQGGWRSDVYDGLVAGMDAAQVTLVDALHVHQGRWWSYQCHQQCCPPSGRVIDVMVQQEVAAILAAGSEPAASREAVIGLMAPDPQSLERVGPLVDALADGLRARLGVPAELEAWRDEQVKRLLPLLRSDGSEGLATDEDAMGVAEAIIGLSDVRVRDTFLWHLAQCTRVDGILGWLSIAMRAAPAGHVAPIATCTAIGAWLHGDGVRANAALERALADDRAYALGWLVSQSIIHGLPPRAWREVMSNLTERECRTGEPAPAAEEAGKDPGRADAAFAP